MRSKHPDNDQRKRRRGIKRPEMEALLLHGFFVIIFAVIACIGGAPASSSSVARGRNIDGFLFHSPTTTTSLNDANSVDGSRALEFLRRTSFDGTKVTKVEPRDKEDDDEDDDEEEEEEEDEKLVFRFARPQGFEDTGRRGSNGTRGPSGVSSNAEPYYRGNEDEEPRTEDEYLVAAAEYHRDSPTMTVSHLRSVQRLPQAIIIGVKKGGTRALLEFLRTHPDIRATGPEIHFFDKNYLKGLDWYRDQMPPTIAGQITVEKTPSYWITKEVPGRVYNMSKDVRLIVVVRDPATRAISDYAQAITKRPNLGSFEQMTFLDNVTGMVDTSWGAIRIGVYAKHLERWLEYFPRRRIHFVNGERLISDPAGELATVQDFLDLKRVITDKHFYFNATKGFPCLKKSEGSGGSPRCLGKTKGRPHPAVDVKVLQRLRDFYRPFNEKFYRMTGIDFAWS